jgi:ribose-phosphate pyrophosphokinase
VNGLILTLPHSASLAERLGALTGLPLGAVESRQFPDGETYLRIDADCTKKPIVIVCTLDRPDDKLLPLVFLADAARRLGAGRIGLVAPYLAYLRQDRPFRSGEAITSQTFAGVLSRYMDWLVTVDPHLHRYRALDQIYTVPNRVVHAAPAVADWIATHVDRPLVVGPDEESVQWVADISSRIRAPYVVMKKTRRGDRAVDVSMPNVGAHRTATPVVVDDIVSSAQTMVAAVQHLVAAGLRAPVCVGVHALFAAPAEDALHLAGAAQIVTTTSIPHATNAIDIMPLLVPAIREFAANG